MELRVTVTKKSIVDRVQFLDADKIDRTRLAEELNKTEDLQKLGRKVSRVTVSSWIKNEMVPEEILPALEKVDFMAVMTNRKPYERKKK